MSDIDKMSGDVVDIAIRVHRELGPGLLESIYEVVLAGKLASMGYKVERQKPLDVRFEGQTYVAACRIDLLVDDRLVFEIKSVEQLSMAHRKQLLTYLRLLQQPVGLLINFAGATLKDGLQRVVNDYKASASPRLRVNQQRNA